MESCAGTVSWSDAVTSWVIKIYDLEVLVGIVRLRTKRD